MKRDFNKELAGFDAVWKRVAGEKGKMPDGIKLMPRKAPQSAAIRFSAPKKL